MTVDKANGAAAADSVQLQFGPSSDVKEVLHLYESLTNKRLLYDNQVVGPVPIVVNEGRMMGQVKKPITALVRKPGVDYGPAEGEEEPATGP